MQAQAANNLHEQALTLERLLRKETELLADYLRLTRDEEGLIAKFNEERVSALTLRRMEVCENLRAAQQERLNIMRALDGGANRRLRDIIIRSFHPADSKKLLPLVDGLAAQAKEAEEQSRQHRQILSFGLKAVHGLLTILWSATQNVVKSYTKKGSLKQSYHPSSGRRGSLKEA
jgi:hypothetical protein